MCHFMTVLSNFICNMSIDVFVIVSIVQFAVYLVRKLHSKIASHEINVGRSSECSVLREINDKIIILLIFIFFRFVSLQNQKKKLAKNDDSDSPARKRNVWIWGRTIIWVLPQMPVHAPKIPSKRYTNMVWRHVVRAASSVHYHCTTNLNLWRLDFWAPTMHWYSVWVSQRIHWICRR